MKPMNKNELRNGESENSLFVLLGEEEPKASWLWEKMPEFTQEKEKFYSKITVRVKDEDGLKSLSAVLGINLTQKTKAIRWPQRDKNRNLLSRWVAETEDESES